MNMRRYDLLGKTVGGSSEEEVLVQHKTLCVVHAPEVEVFGHLNDLTTFRIV